MRRSFMIPLRFSLSFLTLILALGWGATPGHGQPASTVTILRPTPAEPVLALDGILSRGHELEASHLWYDALSYYEDALRRYPGDERLEQRVELAKMHVDVARRYGDASFRQVVRTVSRDEALRVYSDALLKVDAHHVEDPRWDHLARRGAESLIVAARDEQFRDMYPEVNLAALSRLEQAFRDLSQQMPVRDRYDAVQYVSRAAELARQAGIPPSASVFEFLCGAVGGLDDYSGFLTEAQLDEIYSQIEGNFVGLGIELKAVQEGLLVVKVIPASPASQAGLRAGDHILSVNGRVTAGLDVDEGANLLQGNEGSTARLVVATPGSRPRTVRVVRKHVEVPSVEDAKILDPQQGIAYFKLSGFQKTTSREVNSVLWKLHDQGMKWLIMDLRGNPGGLLTAAVELADKFVQNGVLVSTQGRSRQEDFNYTARRPGTWRVPIVVLIDHDSASASEIFAAAIRDHGRGILVGSRSYGKGSVQGIFPLERSGVGLRLTTALFYSPSGQRISKQGVDPHLVVRTAHKPATDSFTAVSPVRMDQDGCIQSALREIYRRTSGTTAQAKAQN